MGLSRILCLVTQTLHFTHWLPEKAEYKCSFKSSSAGAAAASSGVSASSSGFDAPSSVSAQPAGPNGSDVECVIGFEPCALGESVRDTLLLTSATAGVYEVPLMGQCVPPKPQGPIDVGKVSDLTSKGCCLCIMLQTCCTACMLPGRLAKQRCKHTAITSSVV